MSINIKKSGIITSSISGSGVNPNLLRNFDYTKENPYVKTSTNADGYSVFNNTYFECKPGTSYVFSLYQKGGNLASEHLGNEGEWSAWIYLCNEGNEEKAARGSYDTPQVFLVNNFNHTQIGNRHIWYYTTDASRRYMCLRLNNYYTASNTFWGVKIEESSVVTPWIAHDVSMDHGFFESISDLDSARINNNFVESKEFIEI